MATDLYPEISSKIAFAANVPWDKGGSLKKKARDRIKVTGMNFIQNEEAQARSTMIAKKLQLYRKRNLQQSASLRHMTKPTPALEPTTPLNVHQKTKTTPTQPTAKPAAPPAPSSSVRIVYRNKPSTAPARGQGPPSLFLHSATFKESSQDPSSPFESTVQNLEKIWVARRAQEAEEKLQDMDLQDTLSMWAYNQARIEEEINRRQESFQMSSQTGKTCHKIIRRPQTAPLEADSIGLLAEPLPNRAATPLVGGTSPVPVTPLAAPGSPFAGSPRSPAGGRRQSGSFFNTPGGASSGGAGSRRASPRPQSALTSASGGTGSDTDHPTDEPTGPRPISLSPYDNFCPATDKPNMRLLQPPGKAAIVTPDTEHEETLTNKGLLPTHPEAVRSTSFLNTPLDVVAGPNTVFAPSMTASVGKLPPNPNVGKEEPGKDGKRPGSAKPKPKPKPKGKDGKGKKTTRKGPIDPNLLDALFPVLSVEQEVPSLLRIKQMQQVSAIREAFAKQGLALPTSVIEMGLLTPEDRPYMECITNLPAPDMGLVRDFTKPREKKAKTGRKKEKADKPAKK